MIFRLILCEESSRWAAAFHRALRTRASRYAAMRLHEVKTLGECFDALRRAPASVLAVEVSAANAVELAGRLATLPLWFPRAKLIVLGRLVRGEQEWRWRELGAVHVVSTTRSVTAAIALAERHVRLWPESEEGWKQRLWRRLPWHDDETIDN